jgi:hypothetical protein
MGMFSPACANNGGGTGAPGGGIALFDLSQTSAPGQLSPLRDCKFGASSAKVLQHQRSRDRLCILGDRK